MFPQQDEQTTLTKPAELNEIPQTGEQLDVGRPERPIADHLAIGGNEDAVPTLAHLHDITKMSDSFASAAALVTKCDVVRQSADGAPRLMLPTRPIVICKWAMRETV